MRIIKIKSTSGGHNEKYQEVVFIVKSRNVLGQPLKCELMAEDQVVTLSEVDPDTGRPFEFITGFLKQKVMEPKL